MAKTKLMFKDAGLDDKTTKKPPQGSDFMEVRLLVPYGGERLLHTGHKEGSGGQQSSIS